MNTSRPGLLVFLLLITFTYIISGIVFGLDAWIAKISGLAAVLGYGVLLYIVWKSKRNLNRS